MKLTAEHLETNHHSANQETIFWFKVKGHDHRTGASFLDETFGIVEGPEGTDILDSDGCPLTNDYERLSVESVCRVTDDMREDK